MDVTCPGHGRYVTFYNERNATDVYPLTYSKFAYIQLCELEVLGTSYLNCQFKIYSSGQHIIVYDINILLVKTLIKYDGDEQSKWNFCKMKKTAYQDDSVTAADV